MTTLESTLQQGGICGAYLRWQQDLFDTIFVVHRKVCFSPHFVETKKSNWNIETIQECIPTFVITLFNSTRPRKFWRKTFFAVRRTLFSAYYLACVASVSVWYRRKERGTRVKDRAKNGASKRAGRTDNSIPRSFFAPKPNGNACCAGYLLSGKRKQNCPKRCLQAEHYAGPVDSDTELQSWRSNHPERISQDPTFTFHSSPLFPV